MSAVNGIVSGSILSISPMAGRTAKDGIALQHDLDKLGNLTRNADVRACGRDDTLGHIVVTRDFNVPTARI